MLVTRKGLRVKGGIKPWVTGLFCNPCVACSCLLLKTHNRFL